MESIRHIFLLCWMDIKSTHQAAPGEKIYNIVVISACLLIVGSCAVPDVEHTFYMK